MDKEYLFIDTPGFSDVARDDAVLIRLIFEHLHQRARPVHCVLFFVGNPPLRRAEEPVIRTLGHFFKYFGADFFKHMIVVTTHEFPCSAQVRETTQKAFSMAAVEATKGIVSCEFPHLHIQQEDESLQVQQALISALSLVPHPRAASLSGGFRIRLHAARCLHCGATRDSELDPWKGVASDPDQNPDNCHERFQRKYSRGSLLCSGLGVVLSFGILYLLGLPFFTNNTQVCTNCKRLPNTPGCRNVPHTVELISR